MGRKGEENREMHSGWKEEKGEGKRGEEHAVMRAMQTNESGRQPFA